MKIGFVFFLLLQNSILIFSHSFVRSSYKINFWWNSKKQRKKNTHTAPQTKPKMKSARRRRKIICVLYCTTTDSILHTDTRTQCEKGQPALPANESERVGVSIRDWNFRIVDPLRCEKQLTRLSKFNKLGLDLYKGTIHNWSKYLHSKSNRSRSPRDLEYSGKKLPLKASTSMWTQKIWQFSQISNIF